jgi:uncharacterized membrane protein
MSRRALLIALIVSLAVNLFVLGGLAGATLMGFGRHEPHLPPGPVRLRAIGEALPSDRREAWEASVRGAVQTAAPQLRQARALRRQGWADIAAEPANPQAALSALDQSRALEGQARAVMDRAVIAFAASLPPADRAKFAEALSRHGPHPRPGGRWSGGGGPGPGPGPDGPPLPDR